MTKVVKMRSRPVDFIVCLVLIFNFIPNPFIEADETLKKYEYSGSTFEYFDNIHFLEKRVKRQTDTALSNRTPDNGQATNAPVLSPPAINQTEAKLTTTTTTTAPVLKQNETVAIHHNLGEDGHGQRKYLNDVTASANKTSSANYTISEPIVAEEATNPPGFNMEDFEEQEDKLIADHNFTNPKNDTHDYYNSTFLIHMDGFDEYWNSLFKYGEIKVNPILSNAHRRAATLKLSFEFPFYGQPIKNMTIATGGFLFTGDYVHSWLAATQYIAPLMANFDTTLGNDSYVKYIDNGTALTVLWENAKIQERKDDGGFTFAATLDQSGDITFAYKNVPFNIETIKDENHPVKVGLSDAYIIDRIVFLVRRKTIYEYHRVDLRKNTIGNGTVIKLTALPTCLEYTTCQECTNHETVFNCSWCPRMNKCSNGNYRLRQEWNIRNCDKTRIDKESACPKPGTAVEEPSNDPSTSYATNKNSPIHDVIINQKDTFIPPRVGPSIAPAAVSGSVTPLARSAPLGGVMAALAAIVAAGSCAAWIVYAYRNPHTRSGQLLIRYRPSQWGWRRGEARYTAATIHM